MMTRTYLALMLMASLCLLAPRAGHAADAPTTNLLPNGGFEQWEDVPAALKASAAQLPSGIPTGWSLIQVSSTLKATDPQAPVTGSLSRDTQVFHDGKASLRIENKATTDATSISTVPAPCKPKTAYVFRCWVKGQDIVLGKSFIIVQVGFGPAGNDKFWLKQTYKENTPKKVAMKDTFAWRQVEIPFTTGEDTGWYRAFFQIRGATGIVWVDDAELVAVE